MAGIPERASGILAMGENPTAVAVSFDDRVFATALEGESVQISWLDTADYGGGPFTVDISGDQVETMLAVELEERQVFFVGGSQLDVLRWDTSSIPAGAPSVDAAIGFGGQGARLVSLEWDSSTQGLYALDAQGGLLHHIDFSGEGEPALNALSDAWPLPIEGSVADMVRFDEDSLLVVTGFGDQTGILMVDLAEPSVPAVYNVQVDQLGGQGDPKAIAADGEDRAWVFYTSGALWELTRLSGSGPGWGDDDDSAGDDDDSAGDDDDSAGDDDDSAGDDDDSAGDDDDSASGGGPYPDSGYDWRYDFFSNEPEGSAREVIYRLVDGTSYLYTASSSQVQICTDDRFLLSTFVLDGSAGGLAASSATDGALYASVPEMDQVELVTAGPFLTLNSATPTYLPEASDEMVVTFTASMGADEADVCDYSMSIDGDITGGGTVIEGVEGQATHAVENVETLAGEDLEAGAHRLWIYCEDDDGDFGRVSFPFEYSGLAAPAGFALDPEDREVTASWSHDGSSTGYVLYFSDATFAASEAPVFCNGDASQCSPYVVTVSSAGDDDDSAGDDDDSAGDDDDSADSSYAAGDTISVTIDQLTNGTPYYFALAALDSQSSEGPRTDVLSATPSVLGGAAALAGDTGGCTCNSSRSAGHTLPILLLLGLFLCDRRRLRGSH